MGAPMTTESPGVTRGTSPGDRAKTASTGALTSRRAGTRCRWALRTPTVGAAPFMSRCRPRPRRATRRGARRADRARSGRRSGTSRMSTSRPPRPPVTSTAKWRPRVPRRTVSRKRNSATADAPGGRSTTDSAPGSRSRCVVPWSPWTTSVAGAPTGAHPGRGHDGARAGRACRRRGRRSSPGARAGPGSCPAGRAGGRGRGRTGRRPAGAGCRRGRGPRSAPGATAQAPPVATTTSAGAWSAQPGVQSASRARAACAAAMRSPTPSPLASAHGAMRSSRRRSRRRCRSAPHDRPRPDPLDDRVVGVGRGQGALGTTAMSEPALPLPAAGQAAIRLPAS